MTRRDNSPAAKQRRAIKFSIDTAVANLHRHPCAEAQRDVYSACLALLAYALMKHIGCQCPHCPDREAQNVDPK